MVYLNRNGSERMNLFLISTDSKFLLDEELENIIQNSQNKITYDYNAASLQDIIEEASYVSLFQEEKFLIVKNADFLGKGKCSEKESDLFLSYLEHPNPYTTLILCTYDSFDMRKNITKKASEIGKVIKLVSPKNYELTEVVKKKMNKYQTNDMVIRYIIEACLGNYDIIMNELQKLELKYQKKDKIELQEIKKIISSQVSDNVFKFVDATINKNMKESFQLFYDLNLVKVDTFQLMNLLAREYRLLLFYKIYERKGLAKQNVMKELKLQEWQVEKLRKESVNYHEDDLKDCLVELSKLDSKVKSGQYDKNVAFISFLLNILEY